MSARPITIVTAPTVSDDHVRCAATIWSAATAQRDELGRSEPWQLKAVGIRARLALPGAALIFADGSPAPTGFALAAADGATAELYYLAVDPLSWGSGVAAGLLAVVERWATDLGSSGLALWVLDANTRAQAAYVKAGWVATDRFQRAEPSGRLERRFTRALRRSPASARS